MIFSARLLNIITPLLFCSSLVFGAAPKIRQIYPTLETSPQITLPIGIKIWFNECDGKIEGLTSWNDGESFASLGIGHFVWHPRANETRASFNGGFPRLVRYIEKRGGADIPTWLRGDKALYCPWDNRHEFLKNKNSPRIKELRAFLQQTIPIQAECMVKHLEEILPNLLDSAPEEDRPFIYSKFYQLARTPAGIYALVDYMNFKGPGISPSRNNYRNGTGLLHVLKGMQFAPKGSTPLQAFTWSAKNALVRRVEQASPEAYHERWLGGWFKRVNTYLDGDNLADQYVTSLPQQETQPVITPPQRSNLVIVDQQEPVLVPHQINPSF